jgi:hypothetical protein
LGLIWSDRDAGTMVLAKALRRVNTLQGRFYFSEPRIARIEWDFTQVFWSAAVLRRF